MNGAPIITVLTLAPLLGGILIMSLGRERASLARRLALGISVVVLVAVAMMWANFNTEARDLQWVERYDWVRRLAIQYFVGLDGLGLLMVALTALVVPMAMLASWRVEEGAQLYFGLVLLLEAGLIGTFTALNFFHWFLYWELSLIPAYFLIKLWGGPLRSAAATQFFIYTMAGSVALLLAFLALFVATGQFDFVELARQAREGQIIPALASKLGWHALTVKRLALLVFGGAFLGLAVKVPLMPFHSWLPPAYSQAHTGTTMLLTGLMSKMGVYAFIRILLPLFQEEMRWILTVLLALAVVSIVASAGAALAQKDLKKMLAYSSINHLGYCLLGLFAVASATGATPESAVEKHAALSGVFLQMFNHGLTAATLFWMVGMLEQRADGRRGVDDFGGLRQPAPVFCGLMGVALFSSLGLPGLNGFISEFLIFKGAFALAPWAAALSLAGLLITAVFILKILQQVFWGPLPERWLRFPDLTSREILVLAPSLGLMLLLGLYPQPVMKVIKLTVVGMVERINW